MKLRVEKINHIAHLVADSLVENKDVKCLIEKNEIRLKIKELIITELKLDDVVEKKTRQILSSYSRKMPEGSREWDILYQKTYEEEMQKYRQEK